jgi:hypothetical protein
MATALLFACIGLFNAFMTSRRPYDYPGIIFTGVLFGVFGLLIDVFFVI